MNRNRKKRTVYLGQTEEDAIRAIRRSMRLRTDASTVRFAIQDTARRIAKPPNHPACVALIEYLEAMPLLTDRDARQLRILCRDVRPETD